MGFVPHPHPLLSSTPALTPSSASRDLRPLAHKQPAFNKHPPCARNLAVCREQQRTGGRGPKPPLASTAHPCPQTGYQCQGAPGSLKVWGASLPPSGPAPAQPLLQTPHPGSCQTRVRGACRAGTGPGGQQGASRGPPREPAGAASVLVPRGQGAGPALVCPPVEQHRQGVAAIRSQEHSRAQEGSQDPRANTSGLLPASGDR